MQTAGQRLACRGMGNGRTRCLSLTRGVAQAGRGDAVCWEARWKESFLFTKQHRGVVWHAGPARQALDRCLFVSPVLDMKRLLQK